MVCPNKHQVFKKLNLAERRYAMGSDYNYCFKPELLLFSVAALAIWLYLILN